MMCFVRLVTLCLAGVVPLASHAQHISSVAMQTYQGSNRGATQAQRSPPALVTVRANGASLADVLQSIARQGNVRITLGSPVLQYKDRITVDTAGIAVYDAFKVVLRGTGLRMQVMQTGNVVFSPMPESNRAEQGIITGKVIHAKTKQPVAGATVSLEGTKQTVVTGEDGVFRFTTEAGTQTLHVRMVGFARQTVKAVVTDAQETVLEIVLEPNASVLDEVVVTGTVVATERKAIATPITVITAEEIERRGITRIDEFMRGEIPGLVALDQGTIGYQDREAGGLVRSKVYSRGSASLTGDANPVKTYVDGVEILDPSYLGTIDPASIERIEVITGPQAATIYGSGALGGVMQIFTKRGNAGSAIDATLNLKYGILENSFSDGRTPAHDHALLLQGGNGPVLTYSANISHNYTGQWQPKLFMRRYGASLGATHVRGALTFGGSIALSEVKNGTHASNGLGELDDRGSSLVLTSLGSDGTLKMYSSSRTPFHQKISTSSSQILSFNLDYQPLPFWQTHLIVGRTATAFRLNPVAPRFGDPIDSLYQVRTSDGQRTTLSMNTTMQSQGRYLSSTVTVGGNGSWGAQTTLDACLADESATGYIGCRGLPAPSITKSLDDKSWGGFGNVQVGFFGRGFLTAALRGEWNQNYGDEYGMNWTPTLGGTFVVEMDQLTVKALASYGSATRPPLATQRRRIYTTWPDADPGTFLSQVDAPQLGPEYSRGPQAGVEIFYGNLGSFSLNRYVQRVDDLMESVVVDSVAVLWSGSLLWPRVYQSQNVGNMRQHGWSGQGSLNVGPLSLKGTYSWDDSRITHKLPTTEYGAYQIGDGFRGVPTHTGNITVGYAHRGTSLTWVSNYIGSSMKRECAGIVNKLNGTSARLTMYVSHGKGCVGKAVSPGYTKSNLSVSHRVSSVASITMHVTNAFNSFTSDESDLFPSLGRQTLFGISLRSPR